MTHFAPEEMDIIGTRVPPKPWSEDDLFGSAEADRRAAEEARERAEAGIQRAHDNADPTWKETAYAAIIACARRLEEFTADEVWAELNGATPSTHNPSALGPLFRIAASKGLIEKTGRVRASTRATQHCQEIRVWRSRILDRREVA